MQYSLVRLAKFGKMVDEGAASLQFQLGRLGIHKQIVWRDECQPHSIHRVVIAHIDRDDLLITDEQLQRDAIRQVDRHRMQTAQTA